MNIDFSFARAARVLPREHTKIKIYIVGAGGTGSFAVPCLARLAYELTPRGKPVDLTIIDPDRVEAGNIPRSNFCQAEIGRFKAQTLAERVAAAWGLEVGYANEKLDYEKHIKPGGSSRQLMILVGCVDNHLARREIHRALEECEPYSSSDAPSAWWIDGGNGKYSGQVLIGSSMKRDSAVNNHFTTAAICRKLPAPSLIHPELLENQEIPAPRETTERVSCPELVRLGEQSLNINQRVAVEIAEMLTELLLTNSLKRFAAYFDLESGTSRSLYCTPETIEKALVEAASSGKISRSKGRARAKSKSNGTRTEDFYAR